MLCLYVIMSNYLYYQRTGVNALDPESEWKTWVLLLGCKERGQRFRDMIRVDICIYIHWWEAKERIFHKKYMVHALLCFSVLSSRYAHFIQWACPQMNRIALIQSNSSGKKWTRFVGNGWKSLGWTQHVWIHSQLYCCDRIFRTDWISKSAPKFEML